MRVAIMKIRLLICDDSAMARKEMARSLPADWQADIVMASHGQEALDILRAGGTDLLLLDLNMPVLDGYQVLETINEEKLSVMTIVVSSDIQPEARARVSRLGAVDFIRKPLDKSQLAELLVQFGLYQPDASPSQPHDKTTPPATNGLLASIGLTEFLQETSNVAMGQAGDLLARLLNVFVKLPTPRVTSVYRSELSMLLSAATHKNGNYSAVCQGFTGAGLSGEALLLFSDTSIHEMVSLLGYDDVNFIDHDAEVLMDMSSILFGAFLRGLGEQLDIRLGLGQPVVLGRHQRVEHLVEYHNQRQEQLMCIEIPYQLEGYSMQCDLLIFLTEESIQQLERNLPYLTE